MNISSLKRATHSAFITSMVFWLLFLLSKISAIGNISPFAEDPYDAVASFAFQIAIVIALLSLARLVSIKNENGLRQRSIFILRGILLVELCVLATLITDLIAIAQVLPLTISSPMIFLSAGLALLSLLFVISGILLIQAWQELGNISSELPKDALGQTIRDCWTLVTIISTWFVSYSPFLKPAWNWVDSIAHKLADTWTKQIPFANPDQHPWGFAMTFAGFVGFLVMVIIMVSEGFSEGGPANLTIAFLLTGIFFAGETIAIFLSFLFFGGYLGLRPKLNS